MQKALISVTIIALFGCSPIKIYRVSDADEDGIPFFDLMTVNKETSQYEQHWFRFDVNIGESIPLTTKQNEYSWKDITHTVTFFSCPGTSTFADGAIKEIGSAIKGNMSAVEIQAALATLTLCTSDPAPLSSLSNIIGDLPRVGFQRTLDQVPSSRRLFVNMWAPYGGSATGSIKLDARGTLSEAQAGVVDQMRPAVTSALGNVITAAVTGGASLLAPKAMIEVTPPASAKNVPSPRVTNVSVTVIRNVRLYTIETKWPLIVPKSGGASPASGTPDVPTSGGASPASGTPDVPTSGGASPASGTPKTAMTNPCLNNVADLSKAPAYCQISLLISNSTTGQAAAPADAKAVK